MSVGRLLAGQVTCCDCCDACSVVQACGRVSAAWTCMAGAFLEKPLAAMAGNGASWHQIWCGDLKDPAGSVGQGAAVAPDLVQRRLSLLGFDGRAWVQLLGDLVVGLIALYSSHDHINFGPARAQLEQALIKLSSPEVQALYDDEVLERLVGLR